MPRPSRHIALLLAAALSTPLFAAVPGAKKLSVTIYDNIALVQEVRPLHLAAGRSRLEFKDVSASIRPETVSLSAPGIEIVEQNFDFDLLTPDNLMEKAVGQQVQLVRINPGNGVQQTETATVLSVNQGVVLKVGERIEVLHADEVPTRVIFPKIPDNLRANPTLSVTVDAAQAGPREATLTYLTTGLGWRADYVATFDEKAAKLDLQGWITLTNHSRTTFADAETRLVAGHVRTFNGYQEQYGGGNAQPLRKRNTAGGADAGGAEILGDHYIYPLPQRTTIADKQTKQVGFIEAAGVAASKSYRYVADSFQSSGYPAHVEVVVQFSNTRSAGLGAALPAGIVRVYARDARGTPRFIGEDSIGHTSRDRNLGIQIGEAFDVTVQPALVREEDSGKRFRRYAMEYVVRNALNEPVTVLLTQDGLQRFSKVVEESLPSTQLDAGRLQWSVPVAANGDTTLAFTVEVRR